MSQEKALVVMKSGEEHVLAANPYDRFWGRVTQIPGGWDQFDFIYCSAALEKHVRKHWADAQLDPSSPQRIKLKGLGDLPLEKAARLHARFDQELETPHVPESPRPVGADDFSEYG
jgi:uncharacterized protein YbdZ (MbtH family)